MTDTAKVFYLSFLLLLSVNLFGEESSGWVCQNEVEKLYDTPLGTVFKFTTSEPYDPEGKTNFHSIQFQLLKDKNHSEKIKRFVVIDLKTRTFPVVHSLPVEFNFSITISKYKPHEIFFYSHLQGIGNSENKSVFCPIILRADKWEIKQGDSYFPHYEVLSYRLIIDTPKANVFVNVNGLLKSVGPSSRNAVQPENYLSIGICIEKKGRRHQQLLEVSTPTIRFFDNESEISNLTKLDMIKYPYDGYTDIKDRSKKGDGMNN